MGWWQAGKVEGGGREEEEDRMRHDGRKLRGVCVTPLIIIIAYVRHACFTAIWSAWIAIRHYQGIQVVGVWQEGCKPPKSEEDEPMRVCSLHAGHYY